MYLNAFGPNLVVSAAVQTLKSGKVVAHVYYDGKPRTYEDCVRYGIPHDYSSFFALINHYATVYEKVIVSCTC